jgi:hypothetical protein
VDFNNSLSIVDRISRQISKETGTDMQYISTNPTWHRFFLNAHGCVCKREQLLGKTQILVNLKRMK